ncbi:hypothetical protein Pyn_24827 [Prunus yedoensis var. nudiflora]|uniref:Uncharacterized protein n=1 Tax=Prunus yedoensis var. nudiflora TaxID=2094558 RepID=A0A314YGN1_PRUYE|nr:hypothetical protein Pyn_24827 [Prunus yedoensis var. nudiflora]
MERRMRKRRDEFGDGDKHLDDVEDINDGRLSSRDDFGRDGRQKDEKRKDERYREKYREDMDRDNKHRDDKQRDERPTKDQPSSNTRYRDSSRGKKRSPDDRDDCSDTKSRGIKARYSDLEKKSSSGDRVESDVNKEDLSRDKLMQTLY